MYRCQSRANVSWRCDKPVTVMAAPADAIVIAAFLEWAADARAVVTTGDLTDAFADADAKIAAAEEAMARARRILLKSAVDEDAAAEELAELQAAIDAAVAERRTLEAERVVAGVRYRVVAEWPNLDANERRVLLRAGIERVVVHPALPPSGGKRLPVAARLDAPVFAAD